ncbi:MAG: SUMF1/EgtB/PvdO family nonheme iron enzyme [Caldilineaceae bacterium]
MNRIIFANLRNVLASLYPDERSIRRIADDAGIVLAHIEISAHAKNDWHSVLTEANKNNQVEALLAVVEREYSSNKEFRNIYDEYRNGQSKNDEVPSASHAPVNAPKLADQQNGILGADHYDPKPEENQPKNHPIAKPPQSPIAFDWIYVEAGEFSMGLDSAAYAGVNDCELPRHQRFLPDFWVTRTPITVMQFAHFIQITGYKTTAEGIGKSYVSTGSKLQWIQEANWQQPYGHGSNINQKSVHPVTCISWRDAIAFCKWAGVRLPSEAEWEKAARGQAGHLFPWGNSSPTRNLCNFNANVGDTLPVGTFPDGASPYQVLDMAGNVWEWTCSLWGMETSTPQFRYPYRKDDGRENLQAPASFLRVVRGGSWDSRAAAVRATFRGRFDPTWPCNHIGFRVVWSPIF